MPRQSARTKVLEFLEAREAGKAAYALSDRLLDEMVDSLPLNEPIDLGDGRVATLVDQFEHKTTVFRPCGVRRYDLKVK